MNPPTPYPKLDLTHPNTLTYHLQAYGAAEYQRGLLNAAEVCHEAAVTLKNPTQISVAVDCYGRIQTLMKESI